MLCWLGTRLRPFTRVTAIRLTMIMFWLIWSTDTRRFWRR